MASPHRAAALGAGMLAAFGARVRLSAPSADSAFVASPQAPGAGKHLRAAA
eukprot:CAMPEP_0204605712 /NCGR_PEP_ID=MMETSP0661-20131031/58651_1 /ASSEMBLY_ACC=CAM_ASM_000606 /TAXON_ID=109239 /ORGANISM="Alexandrium margalefi, Strain AMGDE01CS-322" /LENGTH=50 /DNA_ID=CAMNT_0051616973 /DNA_START=51 /DNA_END=199 /DNA_ORIENTATION=+